MSGRFAGKVAVITGASRGIGLAIAQRIVSEDGKVVITARKAEALAEAVEKLGGPASALAIPGKADDGDHQQDAVRRTIERFGRIDVLVNNTGVNHAAPGPLLDIEFAAARKIFEVNVLAVLGWVKAVDDAWMAENGGSVVNVASAAGLRPATDIGIYGASKAALIHLTGQLAAELSPRIRVNAVAPAVVKTAFAAGLFEGNEDEVVRRYPLGRLGAADEIASAVAYLASDDAAWTTGQTHIVDGGLTLGGGV